MSLVHNYHSTDPDAPSLSGTAGSLLAVLDALLVTGYGVTTVSGIVRDGATVTVTTSTPHNRAADDVIEIAGADQTDYNGKWKVLSAPSSTTLTFAITVEPVTPATGSMTVKKAALGWVKAFSATNRAAYQPPTGTNQFYLYVDDTTTTYASIVSYETMSDIDTGTGQMPSSGVSKWFKSNAASSAVQNWAAYGDSAILYFLVRWSTSGSYSSQHEVYCFGDLVPFLSTDAYATVLQSNAASGTPSFPGQNSYNDFPSLSYINLTATQSGLYLQRTYEGVGAAISAGKNAAFGGSTIGAGLMKYPAIDNGESPRFS